MNRARRLGLLFFCAIALVVAPRSASAQCGEFQVTPVPVGTDWQRSFLFDVSALSADDAWAVGFYDLPDGPFGSDTFSLAMHWDGTSWTQVPTQNPTPYPGGTQVYLRGVAAIAPDDVWAGGERNGDAGGLSVGAWIHVQHWDGSTWEEVAVPEPPGGSGINFAGTRIYEVIGFASDDVWFGGAWAHPNQLSSVTWRPLAMHWDGSSMTIYDTPTIFQSGSSGFGIRSFSALAPNDIWAVCTPNSSVQASYKNALLHYDGSSWELVDIPDEAASHILTEVIANAADDIWLLGRWYFPGAPFALHYDGSSWTQVAGSPFLSCATATGPDTIYTGSNAVSIFDGSTTEVVESFDAVVGPSLLAMKAAGPCSVWAVGRQSIDGVLLPMAARLEGGAAATPWTTIAGGIPGAMGMPLISGEGSLRVGTPTQLSLSASPPGASTALVVGFTEVSAAFKTGVLVPAPDLLKSGLIADASGEWTLAFAWPAGLPTGASVFLQAWTPDATAPVGFAASDGLRLTQP